jgi:hypothetical protein
MGQRYAADRDRDRYRWLGCGHATCTGRNTAVAIWTRADSSSCRTRPRLMPKAAARVSRVWGWGAKLRLVRISRRRSSTSARRSRSRPASCGMVGGPLASRRRSISRARSHSLAISAGSPSGREPGPAARRPWLFLVRPRPRRPAPAGVSRRTGRHRAANGDGIRYHRGAGPFGEGDHRDAPHRCLGDQPHRTGAQHADSQQVLHPAVGQAAPVPDALARERAADPAGELGGSSDCPAIRCKPGSAWAKVTGRACWMICAATRTALAASSLARRPAAVYPAGTAASACARTPAALSTRTRDCMTLPASVTGHLLVASAAGSTASADHGGTGSWWRRRYRAGRAHGKYGLALAAGIPAGLYGRPWS